jgi:HlyD family secretion protein
MIGTKATVWLVLGGLGGALVVLGSLLGSSPADGKHVQGYVEGEFVYVAAPRAGTLQSLSVQRGAQVNLGDRLFGLDNTPEGAARDEAKRRVAQGRANWQDALKGKRPSELESIAAQLKRARAALALSESELNRLEQLGPSRAVSPEELDRARAARDQNRQCVAQLAAELQTGRLGARADQIAAAEANVRALEAALARAEWELVQMHQTAPQTALIFDILYRPGEWVPAGRPVVALLPPQNIKVRAFVAEGQIGDIKVGQGVRVRVDGVPDSWPGKVIYISPRAEFTPPVIYSRESRAKLVFMIEVVFDPEVAVHLHPGQPVDVQLGD